MLKTTPDDKLLRVYGPGDRPWNVRVVARGGRYGLDDCLENDGPAMLEFYDASTWGGRGEYVSRYHVATLTNRINPKAGICLDGAVPAWVLDESAVTQVMRWVEYQLKGGAL